MKKFLEMEENIESRTSAEGEDDVDIFQTTKVRIVFKDYFMIRKSDMTNKSFAGNIDMTTKVLFPVILQTLKHSQP